MRRRPRLSGLFAAVFLSLICLSPALATDLSGQQRVALVIGNSAYDGSPLRNPVNDARAMADALRAVGFEVLHLENASQTVMEDAIRTFGRRLSQTKGVGLFYFAGHGVQSDGRNYLIPVGGVFSSEADLPRKAVEANEVLARMEQSGNPLNLVILDACRNNPFKKFRGAGGKGGLAAMDALNRDKAGLFYGVLDDSDGFYRGHVRPEDRSLMNVAFTLGSPEQDRAFLTAAEAAGFSGLGGHRSLGGLRASLYNGLTREAVARLAQFMTDYRQRARA